MNEEDSVVAELRKKVVMVHMEGEYLTLIEMRMMVVSGASIVVDTEIGQLERIRCNSIVVVEHQLVWMHCNNFQDFAEQYP
jgi:hypothetical protein